MENIVPDLPDLKILRHIGQGATSHVYEAFRETSQSSVALKVIPLALLDAEARERARREVQALGRLKHPNIVSLLGVHETSEALILELEYIDGQTLAEWLARPCAPRLSEPKHWILAEIAQALAVAHQEGLIHRDLKPENILIGKNGEVKLTDFGLAKPFKCSTEITQPGLLVGSLAYMAPETLGGGKCSFASDIFSFGVIAYELLSGAHPFPHADLKTLVDAICSETRSLSRLPALPRRLENMLLACLSANPTSRPSSPWRIYAELMAAIDQSGLSEDLCARLARPERDAVSFARALEIKYERLKNEIKTEARTSPVDRRRLMCLINEFALLFPDAPETSGYLDWLREKRGPSSRILLWTGASALVAAALVISVSRLFAPISAQNAREQAALRPAAATPVATSAAVTEPSPLPPLGDVPKEKAVVPVRKSSQPPEPRALFGRLKIDVPVDARVFVDGIRYGNAALGSLRLSEGRHSILVEREGYLPIERKIVVKRDVVTRIRFSEGDDDGT